MDPQPEVGPADGPMAPRDATRLIFLLGMVSLFADATYESARSILGPYLGNLGADSASVGLVAGLGELIGYGLRFGSGYLADRTGRYWGLVLVGFCLNMAAVPLLAMAGRWEMVAVLIAVERTGKAIRNPPRDAILSHAAQVVGRGWGFGVQEALGQIGAVVGPLLISAALHYLHVGYRVCLSALAVPATLTIVILAAAARAYPSLPVHRKVAVTDKDVSGLAMPGSFVPFLAAAALIASGSLNFPLVAYHVREHRMLREAWIPTLYSVAMGAHALSALGSGLLFDRVGTKALLGICVLTTPIAPLALGGHPAGLVLSMVLWGLGMGAQKAMFKATVARMAPPDRRGFAYGCLDLCYGLSWFLGSMAMGYLYAHSLMTLVFIAIGSQILAFPVLLLVVRRTSDPVGP